MLSLLRLIGFRQGFLAGSVGRLRASSAGAVAFADCINVILDGVPVLSGVNGVVATARTTASVRRFGRASGTVR